MDIAFTFVAAEEVDPAHFGDAPFEDHVGIWLGHVCVDEEGAGVDLIA